MPPIVKKIFSICLPFLLGIGILWWMYRDADWSSLRQYFLQMNWWWMVLSLVFGVLAQQFRAWRWRLSLRPLGVAPSRRVLEDAVFLSYASSLVVPRVGEVTRCATLKRMDGVSFSRALGTVVTERVVDCVVIAVLSLAAVLLQLTDLLHFLKRTGTQYGSNFEPRTGMGLVWTIVCIVAVVAFVVLCFGRFSVYSKGKEVVRGMWEGIVSLRKMDHRTLYLLYSIAIWACYFLHFYTAFFCFDFTSAINPAQAFLIFCVGTFAVLVPTPNGAGPWHFVVKTLLVLYGVAEAPAVMFALIVHTVQTFEVIVLGVFAWYDLSRRARKKRKAIPDEHS